jgi:hypothetical protein
LGCVVGESFTVFDSSGGNSKPVSLERKCSGGFCVIGNVPEVGTVNALCLIGVVDGMNLPDG